MNVLSNYAAKQLELSESSSEMKKIRKKKPKYPKVKGGAPNPLNPDGIKYPTTIIIRTPMGGKPKK